MIQINRLCRFFFGFAFFYPAVLFAQTTMPDASANSLTAVAASVPVESSVNTISASTDLEPVVVTANRLDTPANQVSSSLTVLTAADLKEKQSSTLLDALRQVPGLHVTQSGGPGQNTAIYTRGGNDDATLIMMDGIPLNNPIDASGSYDYLDQLSLDGVKQIEVVRGPQSALYGSAAMAGVVNIITQDGKGPLGGSALFERGSYGTFQERVSAQGGDTGANFLLAASRFDTSGFPTADKSFGNSLNSPDSNTSGLLKIGASPVSNLGTDLTLRYSQSHTNLVDGGGADGDDPNYFADQKQLALADQSKLTLGDWEQVLGISFVDDNRVYSDKYDPAYPDSADQKGNYDGQIAQLSWQNNLKVAPEETVVLGLQGYKEWGTVYYNSATYEYADYASA
ncbi:MAG: TonB-dependent receptor, partial [bacterium]